MHDDKIELDFPERCRALCLPIQWKYIDEQVICYMYIAASEMPVYVKCSHTIYT